MGDSSPATTGNRHREGVDPIMSDQERQPERDLQAGVIISAWRRYLQPLIGGALVSLVVLAVNVAVHTLVARTLHAHCKGSLESVHASVASAAALVSALVAGVGAVLVEDRVLDERASAPMWLAGCVLASVLYMALGLFLLYMLSSSGLLRGNAG